MTQIKANDKLPPLLKGFVLASIVLAVAAFATKAICKHVLHLPESYDVMVFPGQYRFVDFTCFILRFRDFHHLSFFANDVSHSLVFMYPAPSALVYQFFYLLPWPNSIYLYWFITCSCLLAAAGAFAHSLKRHGVSRNSADLFVAVCLLCSYPFMVNYFLANLEVILGLIIGLGLYLFLTDRTWGAATCFCVAGAMKIFPLIFLALLFQKKQYRQILFAVALMVAITIFSLWLVSGSVAASQTGINAGLEHFREAYALPFSSLDTGNDHSLFGLIKGSIVVLGIPYPAYRTMSAVMSVYLAVTAIVGMLLYFLRIQYIPVLNQVLCLCTIAILFTPASHDYTLMHLYVPFGMFVLLTLEAARTDRRVPGLTAAFICFALLLAPTNEFILHGNVLGGQIKSILLVILLVIGLRYPFVAMKQPSVFAPK